MSSSSWRLLVIENESGQKKMVKLENKTKRNQQKKKKIEFLWDRVFCLEQKKSNSSFEMADTCSDKENENVSRLSIVVEWLINGWWT